ncbi:hypothetical protein tb265_19690 [Gemmatimonadetes bacterium T265]|nr:hypothetical protein tb265_19690 [Gemmatimonadetes bacterium T265]
MIDLRPGLTPERWRRAQAAFHDAVEHTAAARRAVLDAACADDPALRAVVERMLAADADASIRLGPSPVALGAPASGATSGGPFATGSDDAVAAAPVAGRRVGAYQLVREIGRGGMGTVYLAVREDVGKQVALKLVRGGLAAPERVERFLVERRVLARLDHPYVARLLDAGVADDGTPFFAMEYVDGEPLDRYCDARRLGVAARLRLVEQACAAVAYAHRNLVVHRDLKPGNLLVTAAGDVKLLDFGIAKLLAEDAADGGADAARAGLTEAGVRLLTPEYAAPEQVRGEPVTTATDVYALGVVLYELLAGRRPPSAAGPGGAWGVVAGAGAAPRPARPSTAVRTAPPNVAAARGTTPDRLRRRLAGDLDTIVLKALDPEPERRYASAAELLDDLERHRTGFPVRARPNGRAYRARAFVRRNRWGVAAAAGLFALLAGTAAVATVQETRTARAQARIARALAQATAEAAKARQVTRFVASLAQDADPYQVGDRREGSRTGARLGLGLGADRLERELAGQPAVRAELLRTLGVVARNLGRYDDADSLLRRGLATRRQLLGARPGPDAELASLVHELGVVRRAKSDFAGADTLLTQALAAREALPGDGGIDLAATRLELATLRRLQGRYGEAERLLGLALGAERGAPGPAPTDALEELASVRLMEHDADSAAALEQQVVALRERWEGREHPAVARAYFFLAIILRNAGRHREAERAVRRALELQRGRLPADHPEVLAAESELSWELMGSGAYAEAERVQRRVLRSRERLYGDVHRDVAGSAYTLGVILYRSGQPAAAIGLLRRGMDTFARVEGPDHPDVNMARKALAVAEAARGHEAEALAVTARLLRARHVTVWDATAQPLDALATLLRNAGDCRRAEALARQAVAAYTARRPGPTADDPHLADLRAGLHDAAAACAGGGRGAGPALGGR